MAENRSCRGILHDFAVDERQHVVIQGQRTDPSGRSREVPSSEIASTADLVIVLGGDGTMLGAARMLGERGTPVLGVNFGTLGYLTEYTDETLFPALDAIIGGEYELDPRVMLDCEVLRRGRRIEHTTAS